MNPLFGFKIQSDNFISFIQELPNRISTVNSGVYIIPEDADLLEWSKILKLFQNKSFDSCRTILSKYNYELIFLTDASTNNSYDIIREKMPIQYGWGTYIFNRNHKKRLYVHVNHPADDANALIIGANIFRNLKGEWLFIAGTSRRVIQGKLIADVGRVKRTIFHRWHEMLSNLTHVTISLHSYNEKSFPYPISLTDMIISNGRTSDEQWGISQLSLSVRDTLRVAGYTCGLAMYDSGYARLAGGWNVQGIFSNDSVGFGHWLYVELSKKVREHTREYSKLLSAFDRALELTEKKISQQVNRSFGLVSPRVIRIDSARQLFFPTENMETFRFISYDAKSNKRDTIDIQMGNWLESIRSNKTLTSLTVLDTTDKNTNMPWRRTKESARISNVIKTPRQLSTITKFKEINRRDSAATEEDEYQLNEPLQVHRIPLKAVMDHTFQDQVQTDIKPYQWNGIIKGWFVPDIPNLELANLQIESDISVNQSRFFIPIINGSYQSTQTKLLGLEMTEYLLNEIAQLVFEYKVDERDIGLVAEEKEPGNYYLRIFPNISQRKTEEMINK